MSDRALRTGLERPPRILLVATAAVALSTFASICLWLTRDVGLRFVSGTWTTLAVDAASGVVYRPVIGPLGYGGTRYMPLHFLLHGALIRGMGNPLAAGAILTLFSALGLLTGVYAMLRALGVTRLWAVCGVTLSLASSASLLAVTSIRGDLLPAALNVWGIAWLARQMRRNDVRVRVPVLFFALAFAAKMTTLFGLAASITALIVHRERKAALRMAGSAVTTMLGIGLLIYLASAGRVVDSMRVTGTGGAGLIDFLEAPLRFGWCFCYDLAFLLFFLAAAAGLLYTWRESVRSLAGLAWLWTLAGTVCIFGSPGTDFNHFLDLHVVSVVFLIVQSQRNALPRFVRTAFPIAGLTAAVVLTTASLLIFCALPTPLQQERREVYDMAAGATGPILSEDPWVPLVGGERPFMLDPFSLRLACAHDPQIRDDLWAKLAQHYFSGVVLTPVFDPYTQEFIMNGTWRGMRYYGGTHFPPGFIDRLYEYYKPVKRTHEYLIFRPRE